MAESKIFKMQFSKVYPLLIAKAEKKGRTRAEVDCLTCWLTGYTPEQIESALNGDLSYEDFFLNAPAPNPDRRLITGKICGIDLASIEDPLMQNVRYLDKLVDELAKGKPMEKIIRKP